MPYDIAGIDHVHVTTPEELETDVLAWYERTLGLERIPKPEGARPSGAWFRAGAHELHVSIDPHNPPKTAHFALVVDDFDAAVTALRDQGCHIEQATAIPGRHRCFTRDPAGNGIEIIAFDEPSAAVSHVEPPPGERE